MKNLKILEYVFPIIGAGLFIGACFVFANTLVFLKTAIPASGTVVELLPVKSDESTTYQPLVTFNDKKGTKIEFASGNSSNPPSYDVGEKVEVLYNPINPKNAKIKGFYTIWLGGVILAVAGAIFFTVGISFFISDHKKKNLIAYLKLNGSKIETDFLSVSLNTSYTVNDRSPFQILSQWQNPKTSKLHIFKSDAIWFDPTDFIKTDKIAVVIDKNNPKKYHIDLSFLPEVES